MGSLTTILHVARYSKECWDLFTAIADNIEQDSSGQQKTQPNSKSVQHTFHIHNPKKGLITSLTDLHV